MVIFALNYFVLSPGDLPHQILGYVAAGLVVLRIIWGFASHSHASFRTISFTPAAFRHHIAELKARQVAKEQGHNPFGWLMILLTFALFLSLGATGFMLEETDRFFGSDLIESIHEILANTLYAAALIHIAAVVFTSWYGRVALIPAMLTGKRKLDD